MHSRDAKFQRTSMGDSLVWVWRGYPSAPRPLTGRLRRRQGLQEISEQLIPADAKFLRSDRRKNALSSVIDTLSPSSPRAR
jgi:hypothetical protein